MYQNLYSSRKQISLALSHGSRSQIVAAKALKIPILSLDDYEFSDQSLIRLVDRLLVPFPIPIQTWGRYASHVRHLPGLKEELYLCGFQPHPIEGYAEKLSGVNILFRPESPSAHYHTNQSTVLQVAILELISKQKNVKLTIMPREKEQANY